MEERVSAVLARLARVNDPELDESVTSLGFVTGVTVDEAGLVTVGFRLPTYWCAANFAFLMADDMRQEIAALPWVSAIDIALGEHMYAETINRAVAAGRSFQEAFAEEADGNLDEVRRIFALKAFQRRQLALLDHLAACGIPVAGLLGMTIAQLNALELSPDGAALVGRYLERRTIPGPAGPSDLAFVGRGRTRHRRRCIRRASPDASAGHGERRIQRRALPRIARRPLRRDGSDRVRRADAARFRAWRPPGCRPTPGRHIAGLINHPGRTRNDAAKSDQGRHRWPR